MRLGGPAACGWWQRSNSSLHNVDFLCWGTDGSIQSVVCSLHLLHLQHPRLLPLCFSRRTISLTTEGITQVCVCSLFVPPRIFLPPLSLFSLLTSDLQPGSSCRPKDWWDSRTERQTKQKKRPVSSALKVRDRGLRAVIVVPLKAAR